MCIYRWGFSTRAFIPIHRSFFRGYKLQLFATHVYIWRFLPPPGGDLYSCLPIVFFRILNENSTSARIPPTMMTQLINIKPLPCTHLNQTHACASSSFFEKRSACTYFEIHELISFVKFKPKKGGVFGGGEIPFYRRESSFFAVRVSIILVIRLFQYLPPRMSPKRKRFSLTRMHAMPNNGHADPQRWDQSTYVGRIIREGFPSSYYLPTRPSTLIPAPTYLLHCTILLIFLIESPLLSWNPLLG